MGGCGQESVSGKGDGMRRICIDNGKGDGQQATGDGPSALGWSLKRRAASSITEQKTQRGAVGHRCSRKSFRGPIDTPQREILKLTFIYTNKWSEHRKERPRLE